MIFLKVLAVVLGLAFLLFGYFIYFKKKYNLINGFEADFKAGRKKEEYAHYECAHFQDWSIAISNIQYGLFIQSVIDFLIVSFCIFLLIKFINKVTHLETKEEAKKEASKKSDETKLLEEIRDLLKDKK